MIKYSEWLRSELDKIDGIPVDVITDILDNAGIGWRITNHSPIDSYDTSIVIGDTQKWVHVLIKDNTIMDSIDTWTEDGYLCVDTYVLPGNAYDIFGDSILGIMKYNQSISIPLPEPVIELPIPQWLIDNSQHNTLHMDSDLMFISEAVNVVSLYVLDVLNELGKIDMRAVYDILEIVNPSSSP